MAVYGPTMKISSRPITRGGNRRLQSTPASQTRGNGSRSRAIIHARGVVTTSKTPSVTAPEVTETTSGSSAPGAVSELTMAPPDKCVKRAITGPSRATQMTAAPASATAPDDGVDGPGRATWPAPTRSPGLPAEVGPRPKGRRRPLLLGQVPSSLLTAAGRVPGLPKAVGVSSVNPPCLYCARPVFDSVYWTKAMAAGVGVPMIVISITCGPPFLSFPPAIVMLAFLYSAASAKLPRFIAAGSLI